MAKAVSNENLARFLKKCDERYAKAGKGGGGVSLSNIISHPESLPTATADSPDLVEVGGVLYRKKFSNNINLIGTWIFNLLALNSFLAALLFIQLLRDITHMKNIYLMIVYKFMVQFQEDGKRKELILKRFK